MAALQASAAVAGANVSGTTGGASVVFRLASHFMRLWPNCGRRKPIWSGTLDQPSVTKREMAQNPRWLQPV